MKTIKKNLSKLIAVLFIFTLFPHFGILTKADNITLPAADTAVTLVGNFINSSGLGNDWDPTNAQTLMQVYKDGLYEFSVNFTKANSDIEYKVALNRNWDKSYGDNGSNKKIDLTTPQKVYFRFDAKTNSVYDSINDESQFKKAATVTGDMNGWNTSDSNNHMDYMGGGFFKKTIHLAKGTYGYKVAYDDKWSNGEVGSNVSLTLTSDSDVTFLANPIENVCTDSITNPSISGSLSLIGTIRGGNGDWDQTSKNYDFTYLSGDGKYIYCGFFPAGTYQYKGVENYSWDGGGLPASGNVNLTVPEGGKYVVFVGDRANKTMYDSINNSDKVAEALGLQAPPVVVKSPVINPNGSVTFNYENANAKSVYLAGTMTSWGDGKKQMDLIDSKNGIWSITLRLGDAAYNGAYKFIVDGNWITDPNNSTNLDADGNSVLIMPAFSGRKVVLAGTIQSIDGSSAWDPASEKTRLHYDGNGNYSLTLKNVPAGNYEYKIAMGSWDPENYGAKGVSYGENISLIVPVQEDVTFWYNDDSHYIVDSTYYKRADISLKGTGISDGTKLTDALLSGVYSNKVTLNKGTYKDIKAVYNGAEYSYGEIDITSDTKAVTFSFDPTTLMAFDDASNTTIDVNSIYFNSQDSQYKSPYGAVPTDTSVTFNLKTGKDITSAKLVIVTPDGTKLVDMEQNGTFDLNSNKWTCAYSSSKIGINEYYFVVSNGSDVKAYGDDDGYYGPGTTGQLGSVKYYDLNIYDKNFKTPDWMKNAVVYQIFPDRFFDGDTSNDYAQTTSRGNTNYEFASNWYKIPEDPALEYKTDSNGALITDAKGNYIPNPDFKGTKGDGIWSNEMYGGDLKGIQAKLDYLQALGVNALYINPISESISSHRYDTTDYSKVDPLLGHDQDFANLTKEAKKRGMHIILDGVFNHVSDDSIYFDRYGKYMAKNKPLGAYQYWSRVYDLMNTQGLTQQDAEKQVTAYFASIGITDLHYKDWFQVNNVKVPATTDDPEHYSYLDWAGYDSMAVIQHLNGSEYNIKSWDNEIIDGPNANSTQWLKAGANGWRLDVANEIADDVWPNFRKAVKEEGDNVIIGEIWTDASKYLLGNMFDSVMNYRFRDAVLGFVENSSSNNTDAVKAMNELEAMREQYPKEAFEAMLNLVDSHDTQRIISDLDGAQKSVHAIAAQPTAQAYQRVKLLPLIQMTYPGAPTIYYGDEAAMAGADDPDNRRGMIWGKGDQSTVEWYAKLTNIRNAYSVLRTGDIQPLTVDDSVKADVLAYSRNDSTNHALVVINRKGTALSNLQLDASTIPEGTVLTNALNPSEKYTVTKGKVSVNVPSLSGVILVAKYTKVTVNSAALKDAYDPAFIVKDKVRATGISLDKSNVSIKVGEKITLKAIFTPSDTSCTNVTWTTSNASTATVDENGNVNGLAGGNAVITATSSDGGFKASCTVSVAAVPVPKPPTPKPIPKPTPAKIPSIITELTTNTVVGKSVFSAAQGKDEDIIFNCGDVSWTFYGKDITNPLSVDLSLKPVTQLLLSKIIAKIKELTGVTQSVFAFSFNYTGPLPGKATVKIFIGKAWANKNVTLRRYLPDKNIIEEVSDQDCVIVDGNGYATFTLEHCSDYFVTEAVLPKTGSAMDVNLLIYLGTLFTIAGLYVSFKKKGEIE